MKPEKKELMKSLQGILLHDSPSYYPDEDIKKWMDEFKKKIADTFIDGCPFSYLTIYREYTRREKIKNALY